MTNLNVCILFCLQ